jgi:hypothetical protein
MTICQPALSLSLSVRLSISLLSANFFCNMSFSLNLFPRSVRSQWAEAADNPRAVFQELEI